MEPIERMPGDIRRRTQVVLFDIDDTFTLDGRIPAQAFDALERMHEAGRVTIPVTGRPAGWCDHIARMWPVDAVVGENGAFYFRYDRDSRRMERRFWDSEEARLAHRERLAAIAEAVVAEVPGARISADQRYRESDLAVDFCEDVPALPPQDIERINDMFARAGACAKTSSIHVNGWFGSHNKCSMVRLLFDEMLGMSDDDASQHAIFVGDSPNDCPMFEYLPQTVGVANILRFEEQLSARPQWVTRREGGLGFAEMADTLLLP